MKRAPSFTETNQGQEGTCSLHMISRLFVHNIVRPDICPLEYQDKIIPPHTDSEFTSDCSYLLDTEDVVQLTTLVPASCGGIRKYFSTLMYLYAYHSILDIVPHAVCDGSFDYENFTILKRCIHDRYIPLPFSRDHTRDILFILDTLPEMHFHVLKVLPPPKKSRFPTILNGIEGYRARLFMKLCTQQELYMGALLSKKLGEGHSIIISHYDEPTQSVTFKNSWGNALDVISLKNFRGPQYKLSAIDVEHFFEVPMNKPISKLYYLGTQPFYQMYSDAGKNFEELSPPNLRGITRRSARRVGQTRTSHIKASSTQNRRSRASA